MSRNTISFNLVVDGECSVAKVLERWGIREYDQFLAADPYNQGHIKNLLEDVGYELIPKGTVVQPGETVEILNHSYRGWTICTRPDDSLAKDDENWIARWYLARRRIKEDRKVEGRRTERAEADRMFDFFHGDAKSYRWDGGPL